MPTESIRSIPPAYSNSTNIAYRSITAHAMSPTLLSIYTKKTGDKIALAKAIALINNITVTQNAVNGFMPTTWDFCTPDNTGQRTYWINCSYSTVCSLFKLDDLLSHNPPEEGKIR